MLCDVDNTKKYLFMSDLYCEHNVIVPQASFHQDGRNDYHRSTRKIFMDPPHTHTHTHTVSKLQNLKNPRLPFLTYNLNSLNDVSGR